MQVKNWWLILGIIYFIAFIDQTDAKLSLEIHGLNELFTIPDIPDGFKSQLRQFDDGFKNFTSNLYENLNETEKSILTKAVIEFYAQVQAFVFYLLSFDVNDAMNLSIIDNKLAELRKLIGEINDMAGDSQKIKIVIIKLKEAKQTSNIIFTMLKTEVDHAMKDNNGVLVGHAVAGATFNMAANYFYCLVNEAAKTIAERGRKIATKLIFPLPAVNTIKEVSTITGTMTSTLKGVIQNTAPGATVGLLYGAVVYYRNANQIESAAKMRALELQIQLAQAKSTALQMNVLYPEEQSLLWLIDELEELEGKIASYQPGQ
jgi:hypothetical protein